MELTAAWVRSVIVLGRVVVWKARHSEQAISASTRLTSNPGNSDFATLAPDQQSPTPEVKAGAVPEVTGIRHWSSNDSSTVVIDLQYQVQHENHELDNTAR